MTVNNDINKIRQEIDAIDDNLLLLINKRAQLSLEIRRLKNSSSKAVFDSKREEEVVRRLCEKNSGPLYDENVTQLFKNIMKINRGLPDE